MKIANVTRPPVHARNVSAALKRAQETIDALQHDPELIHSPKMVCFWNDLHGALLDLGGQKYLQPFDWPSWKDEAYDYVIHPERLHSATLETLCKLYTLHTRMERFCEGHLQAMLASGHAASLVLRLTALSSASF